MCHFCFRGAGADFYHGFYLVGCLISNPADSRFGIKKQLREGQ
jgi:hypothetical protein